MTDLVGYKPMTNKKNMGIMGLVALAIVAGILIYRDTRGSKLTITGEVPNTVNLSGVDMVGDGNVQIVPINEKKLPPAPTLVRSTDFKTDISPEIKKITISNLEKAIVEIKKDPTSIDNWFDFGLQRKQLGDYEGARDVWEYTKALEPNNIVSWNNLGDLYHFYLKDYKKSEDNWKKTISLQPDYSQGYRGLYELYTYSMPEKVSQIPVILKLGIEKAPEATDLAVLLAEYEKSISK